MLEETLRQCPEKERRDEDPVSALWRYEAPEDQEVVGLVASGLAYGRVALVRTAVAQALLPLGAHPAATLRDEEPLRWPEEFRSFRYRMTGGEDLADLYAAIHATLQAEGSLQAAYLAGRTAPIQTRTEHLQAASSFVSRLRERRWREKEARGFAYLLPNPADGSACKRLHLFFRWMARGPDPIDLGIWPGLDPAALIMPLDTHTGRLCAYLGLLTRKTIDGKAAVEVTDRLARLDPDDPLRYDFALCHLGISQQCIHRYSDEHCPFCPIESACRLAK